MDEYKQLIILAYFKENYKTYDIYELMKLMGMSFKEVNNHINNLIDKRLMCFINDYLILTKIGEKFLVEKNMDAFSFNQTPVEHKKKMSINEIYVPKDFKIM